MDYTKGMRLYDNMRILKECNETGGATIKDGKIKRYKTGFTVSRDKGITAGDVNTLILFGAIMDADTWGLWYDDEADIWGLDLDLIYTEDKAEALELARLYNQKAIYTWGDKKSIYLTEEERTQ